MRVETGQTPVISSVSKAAREGSSLSKGTNEAAAADSVTLGAGEGYLRMALETDGVAKALISRVMNGSYAPPAAELAQALLRKAFDR
jgi:hypothetical protein